MDEKQPKFDITMFKSVEMVDDFFGKGTYDQIRQEAGDFSDLMKLATDYGMPELVTRYYTDIMLVAFIAHKRKSQS